MAEAVDKDLVIGGLVESNEILQEELTRLRNSNRILRTVVRALRASNESFRKQIASAAYNDEMFKSFCEGEFDATVVPNVEGGLPKA